jgi:hypothetical protein
MVRAKLRSRHFKRRLFSFQEGGVLTMVFGQICCALLTKPLRKAALLHPPPPCYGPGFLECLQGLLKNNFERNCPSSVAISANSAHIFFFKSKICPPRLFVANICPIDKKS